jgi:hypothetical protein
MYIAKCCYPGTLQVSAANYPDAVKAAQDMADTYRCRTQVVPVGQDIPIYETTPRSSLFDLWEAKL